MRKLLAFSLLVTCLSTIGFIFWKQELQFVKPTPKPPSLKEVIQGDSVDLSLFKGFENKPLYIHFYNYDCPCSRFNIKEFEIMVAKYKDKINFLAIVESSDPLNNTAVQDFETKYGLGIPTLYDTNGKYAEALGIYSTPQAVLVKTGTIFYKGNYNKARFCTSKNTRFAEMALDALLNNEVAPEFPLLATIPYGCELPSNGNEDQRFLNIF